MADTGVNAAAKSDLPRVALYRDWLGVQVTAPSYYALLGLPELEDNSEAVLRAGRDVKRKLRPYQIGLYRGEALDMLAEVGQAVSVLTNPEKKRTYDAELERRWRTALNETYQTHCEGAGRDSGVLEAWQAASVMRGVPVARLMPRLVAMLGTRVDQWPLVGESQLPLPASLAIYRDAVVLGQCVRSGSLDRRVEAVKRIQKLLGISEALARPVIEEVTRGPHLFAETRLVKRAQVDPDAVLVRIGRRIRRWGGTLGPRGKVLAAMAMLLGKHKRDYERALRRLDEPPVELTPAQQARRLARKQMKETGRRAREVRHMTQQWVVSRPQILIGVAVAVGLVFVIGAILVGGGSGEAVVPEPSPGGRPVSKPGSGDPRPVALWPRDAVPADASDVFKDFIKKYPARQGDAVASPVGSGPEVEPIRPPPGPAAEVAKPPAKPSNGGDITGDFFGVKAKGVAPKSTRTGTTATPTATEH